MEPTPNNRVRIRKTKPSFSQDQKAGFALIIGIGSLALLLGIFYVGSHLGGPFVIDYDGPLLKTEQQIQEEEFAMQRVTDSDGDTLTDFDELYVFKTSPYLDDTDGDGLDDALEIANQTDPTCPEGADCSATASLGNADPSVADAFLDNINRTASDVNEVQSLLTGLSANDVRALLLQSGMTEAEVAALSDEEIILVYNNTLSSLEESGELDQLINSVTVDEGVPADVSQEDLAALRSLAPAEIRDLLIESGADPEVIGALSDEELSQIYFDSLSSLEESAGM